MRVNNENLKKYAELDDAALWEKLTSTAREKGLKVTDKPPTHEELERVRRILRGEEKISMAEAMKILSTYKQKKN